MKRVMMQNGGCRSGGIASRQKLRIEGMVQPELKLIAVDKSSISRISADAVGVDSSRF